MIETLDILRRCEHGEFEQIDHGLLTGAFFIVVCIYWKGLSGIRWHERLGNYKVVGYVGVLYLIEDTGDVAVDVALVNLFNRVEIAHIAPACNVIQVNLEAALVVSKLRILLQLFENVAMIQLGLEQ